MSEPQTRLERASERFKQVNTPMYIEQCSLMMQGASQMIGGCPLCQAAQELRDAEQEDFTERFASRR